MIKFEDLSHFEEHEPEYMGRMELMREVHRLRQEMVKCADKLEEFGNEEPGEVAKHLRMIANSRHTRVE